MCMHSGWCPINSVAHPRVTCTQKQPGICCQAEPGCKSTFSDIAHFSSIVQLAESTAPSQISSPSQIHDRSFEVIVLSTALNLAIGNSFSDYDHFADLTMLSKIKPDPFFLPPFSTIQKISTSTTLNLATVTIVFSVYDCNITLISQPCFWKSAFLSFCLCSQQPRKIATASTHLTITSFDSSRGLCYF